MGEKFRREMNSLCVIVCEIFVDGERDAKLISTHNDTRVRISKKEDKLVKCYRSDFYITINRLENRHYSIL